MTSFPDPTSHWKQAVDRAKAWRGAVLERTLLVERAIDNILTHSFCSDEKTRSCFRELILLSGVLSLSSKSRVLRDLLRAQYPDLSDRYRETIDNVDSIREARNRVAHAQLELPKEDPGSTQIHLTRIRNGDRISFPLSESEVQSILGRCTDTAKNLILLQETIIDRVTGMGENPRHRAFLEEVFRVADKQDYDHILYKAVEIPGSLRKFRVASDPDARRE